MRLDGSLRGQCGESREEVEEELEIEICTGEKGNMRFLLSNELDKIKMNIKRTAHIRQSEGKAREAIKVFGHVRRRDEEYVNRRWMEMDPLGRRKRERPKRKFMDALKEDLREKSVTDEDRRRHVCIKRLKTTHIKDNLSNVLLEFELVTKIFCIPWCDLKHT
nr:uncharacterized protein LOC113829294 [Penaeus vannamei]